jgi:hypothetical protein
MMSRLSEILDITTLRYYDSPRGLIGLVNRTTIGNYIQHFEGLNKNVTLSRAQLQECWFYALHREYTKIMSNSSSMTPMQIEEVGMLLSRGIEQVSYTDLDMCAE